VIELVEAEAAELLRRAGFEAGEVAAAETLALRLLGTRVRRVDGSVLRGADACFCVVNFEPTIWIRRGLAPARQRFAICHEIAEWRLCELRYAEPDVEDVANALAAALAAPRSAFRDAMREHGAEGFSGLARDFMLTETSAALRVGEVTGTPIAVVTPAIVRVRGDAFGWPDEQRIRALARGRTPAPLRRVEIIDERRRIVLLGKIA
jgi:hypothetical protein